MPEELVQIQAPGSDRRTFLKTLGVAGAAAGLTACQNPERILPLMVPDPRQEAGRPQQFSTVCRECPAGCGLMAVVNDGRTGKAEGNPDHPVNRGKLCLRGQTSVQGLYNPDRIRQPRMRDAHGALRPVDWPTALARFEQETAAAQAAGGAGIAWLGQLETGSMDVLIRQWLSQHAAPPPVYYEYFSYDVLRRGFALTHGRAVVPRYALAKARYIVSFGAEFLETWVSNVEYAGGFAGAHSYGQTAMPARFVAVGPRLNLTAANADEYWPARPGSEALLAEALLTAVAGFVGRAVPGGGQVSVAQAAARSGIEANVIERAAARLAAQRPSLVLGPGYGTDSGAALACQVAVNRLNDLLGNTGVTVLPDAPHALTGVATQAEVYALCQRAQAGEVRLLLLHHANPLYHHPQWRAALTRAGYTVSFASWMDETTENADLILPDHHFLESWGDYSPWPGVTGILQPTRLPVFTTRQTGDVLLGGRENAFRDWFRTRWQQAVGSEPALNALLQTGVTDQEAPGASPRAGAPAAPTPSATPAAAPAFEGEGEFYLNVFPSVHFFDGRQANRSWAQEISEPLSKIAWDPWVELHPDTAKRLQLEPSEVVRLRSPHGTAEFSVFITTWVRPDTVGVLMGQGHTNFGMWANGRGDSPHTLQSDYPGSDGLWHAQTVKVSLEKTGKRRDLANLQQSHLQWDKRLALAVPLAEAATALAEEPDQSTRGGVSFYHYHHAYLTHRWGMAIDLSSCIGCNACQAACYAENNIAVWGRSSALSHREMTWIRVELYEGDGAHPSTAMNPDMRFAPIPCQQCGNAPCEYVCPVFAAYHTDEGLNGQVYNRCVGTRYCSNNCIYKVRRFNWYTPQWPEPLNQQLNPHVTVRAKGVMEKCSFCVQRIELVELDARTNRTAIPDGAIQTACQQTCPTSAIIFGDKLDPNSLVSRLSRQQRAYGMLAQENTYPAVSYLKKVKFELNS